MKHHPAPAPGDAPRVPVHKTFRPLLRPVAIFLVLLAAPSVALAQVTITTGEDAEENSGGGGEFIVDLGAENDSDSAITVQYSVAEIGRAHV